METSSLKNSDEVVLNALHEASLSVEPSEELLRATLAKIPTESPDIFRPIHSPLMTNTFSYLKVGIPVFVTILVIAGGTTVATHTFPPSIPQTQALIMSSPADTSDAAITQDSNVIDSELSSLDSSISSTDQALEYTPQH
jgi:hypothetical protein